MLWDSRLQQTLRPFHGSAKAGEKSAIRFHMGIDFSHQIEYPNSQTANQLGLCINGGICLSPMHASFLCSWLGRGVDKQL